jgi:eukaryotic-like serine/threonine-protein kinase
LKLFEREAQTLGRLKHPAIAAIYDGGRTEDGQPYFVMELVQGRPVNEYVRAGKLSCPARLMLFERICEAINYAHQRGVIHRDLKPSNILVDSSGQPKILDFGLARITDGDAAVTTVSRDFGRIIGTLPYMSPEEAQGHFDAVDVRSDVYSLGVILYELLTDQLPYSVTRGSLPESLRIISEDPPRRPSLIDPAVRGDLETIVLKALAKEPEQRYQTAAALADDLNRFLADQPILARRAGMFYRGRKLVQRHKFAFLIGMLVTAVLFGAAFWVHLVERQFQENTALYSALQDFRVAVTEADFAQAVHASRDYVKAERLYRSALATLEHLEREDRAPEVRLGLAMMMIERGNPVDFEEAEYLLRQAQANFERTPTQRREERIKLLTALKQLYGPQGWDLPEALEEVERELEAIELASDPSPVVPAPAPAG